MNIKEEIRISAEEVKEATERFLKNGGTITKLPDGPQPSYGNILDLFNAEERSVPLLGKHRQRNYPTFEEIGDHEDALPIISFSDLHIHAH